MAELADRWYAAWNAKALDRILALYADNVEFASPLVAQLRAGSDGVIRSKGELTEYFRNALERSADMKFKPIAECQGVRGPTLIYANQRGQLVAEQHVVDEAGLIARADVSYAPLPKEVKVNTWKL
jgi:ketosteroid isomerase-like protein